MPNEAQPYYDQAQNRHPVGHDDGTCVDGAVSRYWTGRNDRRMGVSGSRGQQLVGAILAPRGVPRCESCGPTSSSAADAL